MSIMPPPILKQNAIYIPKTDTYIVSTNAHDFITYVHEDGRSLFIDGGTYYFRSGGDVSLRTEGIVIDNCIYENTSWEDTTLRALWGTRGKNGNKPLTYRPIKEFNRGHLRALIKNCAYAHPTLYRVFKFWLKTKYKS